MKRQYGFGLIEVMLAFVIVAATAGTLLQLNKTYLEYSRDGRSREVAMRLAESKLDELRRFQTRSGFDAIAGGSDSISLDGIDYARSWTVTAYAWNSVSSVWETTSASDKSSGKKQVAVTVNWTDAGEALSFSLESVISPNPPASGGPFGTSGGNLGSGKGGPDVVHTPGVIPTVIPIGLGDGLTQETSRPLPRVSRQGNTDSLRVTFNTNVYDGSNNKSQVQDVTTVSCNCTLSTSKVASLPSQRSIVSGLPYWVKGDTATKLTGVPQQNQDPLCTQCCANHFDGPDSTKFSHWYDALKRSNRFPHGHYNGSPGAFNSATTSGAPFLEACRMVRIDGTYEMANDWNLVAFNIFDASMLSNSTLLSAYQSYVKETVKNHILGQVTAESSYTNQTYYTPVSFSSYLASKNISPQTTNLVEIAPGPHQLMARGVYVDIVSPEYRQYLKEKVIGESGEVPDNFLKYVPFYDVNLTLLANWSSSDLAKTNITVSNEVVQTIVDSSKRYYGVYSRGLVNAIKEGSSATITATIRRSNSGISAFRPLSEFETTDIKSSALNVSVQTVTGKVSITGPVRCITYETAGETVSEQTCSDSQLNNIAVTFTQSNKPSISCSSTQMSGQGANKGNLSVFYRCYADNGPEVTLTATAPTGYELVFPAVPWTKPTNTSQGGNKSIDGGCLLAVINRPKDKVPSLPQPCQ